MTDIIKAFNQRALTVVGVNAQSFDNRVVAVRFEQPSAVGKISDGYFESLTHIHPEAAQPIYPCGNSGRRRGAFILLLTHVSPKDGLRAPSPQSGAKNMNAASNTLSV